MLVKKALGATAAAQSLYVEDVFQSWLRTGTGADATITTNIDMTKGYMLWSKGRSGATDHAVYDSARGVTKDLVTNSTAAETTQSTGLKAVSSTGYTVGSLAKMNTSSATYVDWTFRKAEKFFDVVTYTGNYSARTISHNLGSVPGCIIVKPIDAVRGWSVWHRSAGGNSSYLKLETTDATQTSTTIWNNTAPTSTTFSVGASNDTNSLGTTYVAYLFAHNAGGFGETETDNVISCDTFFYGNPGTTTSVNLGYEPQWVLIKAYNSGSASDKWILLDSMRGWSVSGGDASLSPNLGDAESTATNFGYPTSTGFDVTAATSSITSYIYIAIRRGPMKTPEAGTSVFSPVAQTNSGSQPFPVTAGFPVDSAWFGQRNGWGVNFITSDRLRGATNLLLTTSTNDEATNNSTYGPSVSRLDSNTQFKDGMTNTSEPDIYWMFGRAPGFFDVVCYTGDGGSATSRTHNLSATPEFIIAKRRNATGDWVAYAAPLGPTQAVYPGYNFAAGADSSWGSTSPTTTQFTVGGSLINIFGATYVAYLFGSVTGVSKVGSYTGTGTTLQVNCGFTGGARFVLIKRTDSTGDWYIWDTARGIVSGNDPYLLLNSTAAEVTNTDYIDTYSQGFEISSTAPAAINANGGTFIFFAVA